MGRRLIDANALIAEYDRVHIGPAGGARKLMEDAPTIEAEPVVHSWWEKSTEGYRICHHCKADVAIFSGHKNYCPECGARMDGGDQNE